MNYEEYKDLKRTNFKRLVGVEKETFNKMVEILKIEEKEKKKRGGKPSKILIEDKLLMAFEYWREYRTFFHIAVNHGISESQCYRNTKWIEDKLIKNGTFSLPKRKEILQSENEIEIIIVDATESIIERPKKNKEITTQGKRKNIQ
jgi:hypothetical protein